MRELVEIAGVGQASSENHSRIVSDESRVRLGYETRMKIVADFRERLIIKARAQSDNPWMGWMVAEG